MNLCPHCGEPLDAPGVIVRLETNTVHRNGKWVNVTPQQAEVLTPLASGRVVSQEHILERVYGARSDVPDGALVVLRQQVHFLGPKLRALGLLIRNIRGRGYILETVDANDPSLSRARRSRSRVARSRRVAVHAE